MNRREFGKRLGTAVLGTTFPTSIFFENREATNTTISSQTKVKLPNEVAGIPLIDSKVAQEATDLARETSPPFLFNHSIRTYLFGALLGKDLAFDHELLFLACILHDLGLTDRYAGEKPFEIEGAEAARKFFGERGVSEERTEIVWDGIAMHPSALAHYKRPEIALVANGAAADVVGSDLLKVAPADKEQVLRAFPRFGFKTSFTQTCAEIVQRYPGGAYHSFMRDVGERHVRGYHVPNICDAITEAPFAE
jgi:HD domain